MIQPTRVQPLNNLLPATGHYVLYWMQASQRVADNHALEFAIGQANALGLPLIVLFGITDNYPEANERHYAFMLEGLKEVRVALAARGILFIVRHQLPEHAAVELAQESALVVVDCGYTRIQCAWRAYVAQHAGRSVLQVESDIVVPVEVASGKEEYAARTLRTKIQRELHNYLHPVERIDVLHNSLYLDIDPGLNIIDTDAVLATLQINRTVGRVSTIIGGEQQAQRVLQAFIQQKLKHYADDRNDPSRNYTSGLSPYLHFGQISPLAIALAVRDSGGENEGIHDFLEELIVRRELSINFVWYNNVYDSYNCAPVWAKNTLKKHGVDKREYLYSRAELEQAQTHDPYWNAAMVEMVLTGTMKNYMRMYWGKKVLEWTKTPKEAFDTLLHLNNKYFLDGRDPNSFAGVAWIFGKHDRPWGERPIFGTVRYMNAAGLLRKFDIDEYVRQVSGLEGTSESAILA